MNRTPKNRRAPVLPGWAFFFLLGFALLACVCGRKPAPPPSGGIRDATGTLVNVPPAPRRIVSLLPSATETLFRLGVGDRVIGVTTYCTRPDEAKALEKVGTFTGPNLEKILSLKPDLVLAGKVGNPGPVLRLRDLGVSVFVLGDLRNFSEVEAAYVLLGSLVGCEDRARRDMAGLRERLDAIRARTEGRDPVRTFVVVGSKPLITAGPGSCVDDILSFAGADNASSHLPGGYPRVEVETVLSMDPETILIATMAGFPEEEKKRWLGFESLRASREGRVFLVNGDDLCRPDPFAFASAAESVSRLLHPDAFQE